MNMTIIHTKVTVNTFIMLQKISILNKCCSFELSIHQIILKNMNTINIKDGVGPTCWPGPFILFLYKSKYLLKIIH